MISNHSGFLYAHWAVVTLWILAGALFILFLARWRRGRRTWILPAASIVLLLSTSIWTWSASHSRIAAIAAKPLSTESQAVMDIVVKRCQACHSDHATMMSYASFTLSLNTMQDVDDAASPIYRQVVELQQMPMANTTHMTDGERATIARWYASKRH